MDAQLFRDSGESYCATLLDGDMARAAEELGRELRSNLGPLVATLPLPVSDATSETVEVGGSDYVTMLRLVGESGDIELRTHWKDRDGRPTLVEASHVVIPVKPRSAVSAEPES